jgi:hypothetical protein
MSLPPGGSIAKMVCAPPSKVHPAGTSIGRSVVQSPRRVRVALAASSRQLVAQRAAGSVFAWTVPSVVEGVAASESVRLTGVVCGNTGVAAVTLRSDVLAPGVAAGEDGGWASGAELGGSASEAM